MKLFMWINWDKKELFFFYTYYSIESQNFVDPRLNKTLVSQLNLGFINMYRPRLNQSKINFTVNFFVIPAIETWKHRLDNPASTHTLNVPQSFFCFFGLVNSEEREFIIDKQSPLHVSNYCSWMSVHPIMIGLGN